ncbi:MAG: hypothetical protein GY851_33405 [bacterium]|nr:hypothetical protein [bacterium]
MHRFSSTLTGLLLAGSLAAAVRAEGAAPVAAKPVAIPFECAFTEGGWNREDWVLVRRPDWDHKGDWIQRDDCIENETPDDATDDEMVSKRAKDTFTSMVLKEPVEGDVTVTSTMAFAHRMAPSIVLAAELGERGDGDKEYRGHFEVVLFDLGVNVWRHTRVDGKSKWEKRAYARFPVQKDAKYTLTVTKKANQLIVAVDDFSFAYTDDTLPEACYVGITGAEGVNRFYDFGVKRP